jgi:hypothetical protein
VVQALARHGAEARDGVVAARTGEVDAVEAFLKNDPG